MESTLKWRNARFDRGGSTDRELNVDIICAMAALGFRVTLLRYCVHDLWGPHESSVEKEFHYLREFSSPRKLRASASARFGMHSSQNWMICPDSRPYSVGTSGAPATCPDANVSRVGLVPEAVPGTASFPTTSNLPGTQMRLAGRDHS